MTAPGWPSALSPFAIRGYRFQWSADLATSWAFEMETVLLGWFIVVETQSVLLVTLFGTMQFLGTLIAPFFGLLGDRIGQRTLLFLMRAVFVALAAAGAALTLADMLTPALVLVISGLAGLVRPSDTGMRNVLIAETVPWEMLMRAISLSRITMDSARAIGALTSGAIVVVLGMKGAYPVIVVLYALGALLTLGVTARRRAEPPPGARPSPLRDLLDAVRALWHAPPQLAAMVMAFIVNVTAFPFTLGLLPYVARDVYGTTQVGLGYMVAGVAAGSVVASLILSIAGNAVRPARMLLGWSLVWHALLVVLGQVHSLAGGLVVLPLIGFTQMLCMLPLSVLLLRGIAPSMRGRVMGMRTLAVYGLPLGLLASGPLIDRLGFPATAALYGGAGIVATLAVLAAWHRHLWPRQATANEG